jgi:hypothetical protein
VKNTSHFLQPLDDLCFARFKQVLRAIFHQVEFRGVLSKIEYTGHLYAALYEAEQSVFTPRLLRRAFENCGLWPFDPQRILRLTQQNVGQFEKQGDSLASEASRIIVEVMEQEKLAPHPKVSRKRTRPLLNTLHSPWDRQLNQEREKYEREVKRKKKQQEKDQRDFDKRQEVRAKKVRRLLRTCRDPSCDRCCYGGKNWRQCTPCEGFFCPKHKSYFENHPCVASAPKPAKR